MHYKTNNIRTKKKRQSVILDTEVIEETKYYTQVVGVSVSSLVNELLKGYNSQMKEAEIEDAR